MESSIDNVVGEVNIEDLESTPNAVETQEPKYGLNDKGEYISPYQTTVFYNPASTFETSAAFLAKQAQLIPVFETSDFSMAADVPEYISPDVVVFSDKFTDDLLQKFLARGFETVHVFDKMTEPNDGYFDPKSKIVKFGPHNLRDHIGLIRGMLPIYLMEKITCANFSDYKSTIINEGVNATAGRYLCVGINHSGQPFGKVILEIASSLKGFEMDAEFTMSGKMTCEIYEKLARNRIYSAHIYDVELKDPFGSSENLIKKRIAAIPGPDLAGEIANLIPSHPKIVKSEVDIGVVYAFTLQQVTKPKEQELSSEKSNESEEIKEPTPEFIPGYNILLVSVGKEHTNVFELLKSLGGNPQGGSGTASAWLPLETSKQLLTLF
jgi:hypothetical protein